MFVCVATNKAVSRFPGWIWAHSGRKTDKVTPGVGMCVEIVDSIENCGARRETVNTSFLGQICHIDFSQGGKPSLLLQIGSWFMVTMV